MRWDKAGLVPSWGVHVGEPPEVCCFQLGGYRHRLPCSHLRSPFGFMFESDYTILGQKVSLSRRRAKRWKGREEGRIAGLEIIITIS